MSVASQCPSCCKCLPPVARIVEPSINWTCTSTLSNAPVLCGFAPFGTDTGDRYLTKTFAGSALSECCDGEFGIPTPRGFQYSGAITVNAATCVETSTVERTALAPGATCESFTWGTPAAYSGPLLPPDGESGSPADWVYSGSGLVESYTGPEVCSDASSQIRSGTITATLSDPDTIENAIARSVTSTGTDCCAFTGEKTGAAYGPSQTSTAHVEVVGDPSTSYTLFVFYSNGDDPDTTEEIAVTTDSEGFAEFDLDVPQPDPGKTRCLYAIRAVAEYWIRHPAPASGCYRAQWRLMSIGADGTELDSVEIVSRGVTRPAVSWSGGGGSGLLLIADMASDGSVSAIRVLNPGSGYTSEPTITVETAINGGTTSTGWVATLSGNQVASVARVGGTAGDYLPLGAFSGGGGSGAAVTFTLDSQGGIATASLTPGSGYTSEPALALTYRVASPTPPQLQIHMAVVEAKCETWTGSPPEGYDPEDEDTWPEFGPFLKFTDSTIVALRGFCDCSSCP